MTTFFYSRIAVVVSSVALFGSVTASAEQSKSPEVLTAAQVIELSVNPASAVDHQKVQKHYLAVAAQNDAEAARNASMAEFERNNPNRGAHFPGSSSKRAARYEQRATANRVVAEGARAEATQHELVAGAIGQGDVQHVQAYLQAIADKFEAEAATHVTMREASRARANGGAHFPGNAALRAVKHCEGLSASLKTAAQTAREGASELARINGSN